MKLLQKRICPVCGCEFEVTRNKRRYITCSLKCRGINSQKVKRPSRSELKSKIRYVSFLKLGSEYGISDNSVRKWCVFYGLPHTKSQIFKYSDEEWNLL